MFIPNLEHTWGNTLDYHSNMNKSGNHSHHLSPGLAHLRMRARGIHDLWCHSGLGHPMPLPGQSCTQHRGGLSGAGGTFQDGVLTSAKPRRFEDPVPCSTRTGANQMVVVQFGW